MNFFFGAHIHALTEPDPETGDWLVARRAKVRELLATLPDAVCLDQYSNPAAPRAHADGTMTEIVEQLGRCEGSAEARLSQLQGALKCGTNCGSCLPVLRGLVRASIPLVPVAG